MKPRIAGSPSKAELARKLRISADTAGRALRELADMGIVHQVPGHGYFPYIERGNDHLIVGGAPRRMVVPHRYPRLPCPHVE